MRWEELFSWFPSGSLDLLSHFAYCARQPSVTASVECDEMIVNGGITLVINRHQLNVQNRSNSVPAMECREFLLAVVNNRPGLRKRYAEWFPRCELDTADQTLAPMYSRISSLWSVANVPPPPLTGDPDDIYLLLLQHKLRVIWERRRVKNNPTAAVNRLISETRELQHYRRAIQRGEPRPDSAVWCSHTTDALEWLKGNTDKLLKCAIDTCNEYPYFIRQKPNQRYCSEVCSAPAERKRVEKRPPKKVKGPARLSAEGRAAIVKAQRSRWAAFKSNQRKSRENRAT
jgi:hypothetical protein